MSGNIFPTKDLENLTLNDFLNMSDVASAARKLDEQVEDQLNIDDKKNKLKKTLIDTALARGEELTEAQANIAVENFFTGLYSFKEPKSSFEKNLAGLYVDRAKIGKYYGLPVLGASILAGVVWMSSIAVSRSYRLSEERSVEKQVVSNYEHFKNLETKINDIRMSDYIASLPDNERSELKDALMNSEKKLNSTFEFFHKYCSNGTADDDVTQENYSKVLTLLPSVTQTLGQADGTSGRAQEIVSNQSNIYKTRKSLDLTIEEMRKDNNISQFLPDGEKEYSLGIVSLNGRNINEAKSHLDNLMQIRSNGRTFSSLVDKVERVYLDINTISKEEDVKAQGQRLYNESKEAIKSRNVQSLTQTVNEMDKLDEALNQEFKLIIVDRSGVKSGIDRYYNKDKGKPSYYIIVEAVRNGVALPRYINNFETGKVERVTIWGEKVSNDTYERVKADKMDNHHVDNNLVGHKQKGYLNPKIIFKGLEGRQITHW